jgi:hypothetical protein
VRRTHSEEIFLSSKVFFNREGTASRGARSSCECHCGWLAGRSSPFIVAVVGLLADGVKQHYYLQDAQVESPLTVNAVRTGSRSLATLVATQAVLGRLSGGQHAGDIVWAL